MLIVCLAKSKKWGGRCVAGVEVALTENRLRVVQNGSEPRWIRPVTGLEHGEVPAHIVRDVALLDIVEIPNPVPEPNGYQVENVRFTGRLRRISRLPNTEQVLQRFMRTVPGPIFGNHGKAVPSEIADQVGYSLQMVRAEEVDYAWVEGESKKQLRARFLLNGREQDLPVTDPEFEVEAITRWPDGTTFPLCFLTVSLGLPLEGWHYKLIAGVFPV